ncbi:MAG: hypothetical protein ABSG86_27915 [Thermoguttaceae bacterium]|jgi:PHD/YefM family antitoxin component YafN of YafNO toxin-antitoxin module
MATAREQFVVDGRGKRTAVILSSRRYEQMLEDLRDLAVVAERRGEKSVDQAEMRRRLKKHGLL